MSITEARAQGEVALARYDEVSRGGYGAGEHAILASALRALLAALPETPTTDDDELENLTYLITAKRFHERGLKGAIGEPDLAVARPLAEFLIANGLQFRRPSPPTEDQWEYGAIWEGPTGVRWYAMEGDAFAIREAAEREVERYGDPQIVLGRRRKAGPWEPVEAAARVGGESDAASHGEPVA